jgi:uncharacterized protein (DUF1501 family)
MANLQTFVTGQGDRPQTLVVVFLRGGADGLSLVAPVEDDQYQRSRPRIAVSKKEAVSLDGLFGLNPLLKPLEGMFKDGSLVLVPAAGSEDQTRSHFEAQDLMEHGGVVAGGWLGRFLRCRSANSPGALSAIAIGRELPECLRGAPSATVLQSIDEFSLGRESASLIRELGGLYARETGVLGQGARDTIDALHRIDRLRATVYHPEHGASYGQDDFSLGLLEIARLIKAKVGLEAASIDLGGWDSHFTQGTVIDPLMVRLAQGLAAFYRDLGPAMAYITVVVMTEFGRRVRENASFGTDHGRGSIMMVVGGGVRGGRVVGAWPGLSQEVLEGPGDVPVANNYRDVLAPVLARHGAAECLPSVFPGFDIKPLPLYG